jgi:hypothetical protein
MKRIAAAILMIVVMTLATPAARAESKSYWGRGMWIGALSGAVVGGGVTAGLFVPGCGTAPGDDMNTCALVPIAVIGGTAVGALVGMGIGAAIGAAIKKQPKVVVAPTVMGSGSGITGGGVGIRGSF